MTKTLTELFMEKQELRQRSFDKKTYTPNGPYHKVLLLNREMTEWFGMLDEPFTADDFEGMPYEYFSLLFKNIISAGPDGDQVFKYIRVIESLYPENRVSPTTGSISIEDFRNEAMGLDKMTSQEMLASDFDHHYDALSQLIRNDFGTLNSRLIYLKRNLLSAVLAGSNSSDETRQSDRVGLIQYDVMAIGSYRFLEKGTEVEKLARMRLSQLAKVIGEFSSF